MGNELRKFNYQGVEIITMTDKDEQTWFIAETICSILELSDVSQILRKLDEDDKMFGELTLPDKKIKTWIINEFGVYQLYSLSQSPDAKKFKQFTWNTILRTIREIRICSAEIKGEFFIPLKP